MDATAINALFQSWYNQATTYMTWPIGLVVASVFWITLLILIIGLIISVIRAVKGS